MQACIDYIKNKHSGQLRQGGLSYHTHPIEVMHILENKRFSTDLQKAGLFHDLLEDTDATKEEIIELSNLNVYTMVVELTKVKGIDIQDYLLGMSEDTKLVKLADRVHNLRSAKTATIKFIEKYIKETEYYYIDFSKGTLFETDIKIALDELKQYHKEKQE